jgi:hypothetical protein
MSRLFMRNTARWMIIGVVAVFAIGWFPAIAIACEGAGEEVATEEVISKRRRRRHRRPVSDESLNAEAEITNL